MAVAVNRYRADLREFEFVLFEQFRFDQVAGTAPFEAWGAPEAKAMLAETYRFCKDVLGPLNGPADREGCRLESGQVKTPQGFKQAWKQLYEAGFKSISVPPIHGGQGAPKMLYVLIEELLCGANTAFNMYPGLAFGAGETIAACSTPDQIGRYVEKIFSGTWAATMCLTEPQAGSDVGASQTRAEKNIDGTYQIRGTKIYISGGDHDLAENIVHLVLARVKGAPAGTKGLSLFIVPKNRVGADGTSGASNDVQCSSIEHKMGINGSATCVLNFGDNGGCVGELVGTAENAGMSQMFKMMNTARLAVGLQGLAVASSAYLNALEYARERKQGSDFIHSKDPLQPRVPLVHHADIRRMLLDSKAHTEGIRALIMKVGYHTDCAHQWFSRDAVKAAYHQGQVELLTPMVKAYSTDQSFRICEMAIQTFGGAGYLKDHPVEQYCRDSKIFSIYEGTNHIQALDLVGRKLGQAGGKHFQEFSGDLAAFIELNQAHPSFKGLIEQLQSAHQATISAALKLLAWSQEGKANLIPLVANAFLQLMTDLALGWLLLDAAVVAERALASLSPEHPERFFYEGKKWSAVWFVNNVLATVPDRSEMLISGDTSALEIPVEAFATL